MSRVIGNYTLHELLGRGATSEVYAGRHRFLDEDVAVKLMRSEMAASDQAAAELVAEATRTRAVDHPNVVRVLDVGRDELTGRCYMVMERLDGDSLAARLRAVGRLPEAEARRLGAAIADGMQAAHDRGIVHRDLKPANIMLRGDSPTIVDFGIAKHLGAEAAVQTQRRIGTPAYMAPEQLTGGLIAPCVDVWALGVILFELVTGRLPFDGYDDGRCPQLVDTAPRLSRLVPVSPAFDALVARCLARAPGDRPQAMSAIAAALRSPDLADDERYTDDLGPIARPSRPRPPMRRHHPLLLVAPLPLLAVALFFTIRSCDRRATTTLPTPAADSPSLSPPPSSSLSPASPPSPSPSPSPSPESKERALREDPPAVETPRPRPRPKPRRPAPKKPTQPPAETLD